MPIDTKHLRLRIHAAREGKTASVAVFLDELEELLRAMSVVEVVHGIRRWAQGSASHGSVLEAQLVVDELDAALRMMEKKEET